MQLIEIQIKCKLIGYNYIYLLQTHAAALTKPNLYCYHQLPRINSESPSSNEIEASWNDKYSVSYCMQVICNDLSCSDMITEASICTLIVSFFQYICIIL